MAYVNGCTIVDYGACVYEGVQGILRKRVWPAPVQWMAVIRTVQLWKVRMPLLIRSGVAYAGQSAWKIEKNMAETGRTAYYTIRHENRS